MTKVVLNDAETVAALDALQQRAEICDSQGRVMGYFVPQSLDRPRYFLGVKSPLSKEERERLLREELKDAKTLPEFWEEMRRKHPEKFQ
jgi:hypothetical protein